MRPETSSDITRIVLFVLVIGALLAGSAWTLLPFLSGMIWATTIAVATWPALLRVQRFDRRTALAGGRDHDAPGAARVHRAVCARDQRAGRCGGAQPRGDERLPHAGTRCTAGVGCETFPCVGARLADRWQDHRRRRPRSAHGRSSNPTRASAAAWAIAATGGLGSTVVLILLTIVLLAILYSRARRRLAASSPFRIASAATPPSGRSSWSGRRSAASPWVCPDRADPVVARRRRAVVLRHSASRLADGPRLHSLHRTTRSGAGAAPAIGWLYWTGNIGWATALLI